MHRTNFLHIMLPFFDNILYTYLILKKSLFINFSRSATTYPYLSLFINFVKSATF